MHIYLSIRHEKRAAFCLWLCHLTFQIKKQTNWTTSWDNKPTSFISFFSKKVQCWRRKVRQKDKICLVWCQTSSTIEHTLTLKCSKCCMNYHNIIQFRVIKVKLGAKHKLTSFSLDFFKTIYNNVGLFDKLMSDTVYQTVDGAANISDASHWCLQHRFNSHSFSERCFSSTALSAQRKAAAPTSLSCSDMI